MPTAHLLFFLLVTRHSSLITSFVIVFEPHDVVFAEIVAELNFDERERMICAVAETVNGFGGNVKVFAHLELEFPVAANDRRDAVDNDPVLAAPRVALQAQARARFDFKPFDFVASALFQHLIAPPRSLFRFSHSMTPPDAR
jgi:hypothetical protein